MNREIWFAKKLTRLWKGLRLGFLIVDYFFIKYEYNKLWSQLTRVHGSQRITHRLSLRKTQHVNLWFSFKTRVEIYFVTRDVRADWSRIYDSWTPTERTQTLTRNPYLPVSRVWIYAQYFSFKSKPTRANSTVQNAMMQSQRLKSWL